jgi:hypothetical protein
MEARFGEEYAFGFGRHILKWIGHGSFPRPLQSPSEDFSNIVEQTPALSEFLTVRGASIILKAEVSPAEATEIADYVGREYILEFDRD